MLNLQNKNIDTDVFSFKKNENELIHIANTNKYHIVIFKENGECEINFNPCKIKQSQVLFLNPSDIFKCKNIESNLSYFSFSHKIFDENNDETQKLINGLLFDNLLSYKPLNFNSEELLNLETELKKVALIQTERSNNNLSFAFKEVISKSIIKKHNQLFFEEEISENHKIIYKYLSLINENFKMEHNVFIYAKMLGIQPKVLTKLFSDFKIENPKEILKRRILVEAKRILAYSSKKSTEISYEVGFNEPAYFARFFKKNTGLTPKQFRIQKTCVSIN